MITISVPTTARVTSGLQADLPGFTTRVNLEWDIREPSAIAFVFAQPGDVTVTQRADREVLSQANTDQAAHTHGFSAYLTHGRAVLAWDHAEAGIVVSIDGSALGRFLLATYAACPLGAEDIDVDGLIAQLLEGA